MENKTYLTTEEKYRQQMEYERRSKHMESFKRPPYQHTVEEVRRCESINEGRTN